LEVPEAQMDPITAVSGSGPAYVFYTMESMFRGATRLGLSEEVARLLVEQTVLGAARLAADSTHGPEALRHQVTSKGGTTEAAMTFLQAQPYQEALIGAIEAACLRARELGTDK